MRKLVALLLVLCMAIVSTPVAAEGERVVNMGPLSFVFPAGSDLEVENLYAFHEGGDQTIPMSCTGNVTYENKHGFRPSVYFELAPVLREPGAYSHTLSFFDGTRRSVMPTTKSEMWYLDYTRIGQNGEKFVTMWSQNVGMYNGEPVFCVIFESPFEVNGEIIAYEYVMNIAYYDDGVSFVFTVMVDQEPQRGIATVEYLREHADALLVDFSRIMKCLCPSADAPVVEDTIWATEHNDPYVGGSPVYVVITAATAKVRGEASTSGTLIKTAYEGELYVLIETRGDWYGVDVDGQTCYIHSGVAAIQ